ncbi:MAG: DUF2971 domain-containing protein [Clostridia bacterium]|nr:DUF2971 domain-containing protein [Clostridia bacterium]
MLTNDSIIYHYCSVAVFQKIIETNTIWLTHARQTNDVDEGIRYIKPLQSVVNSMSNLSDEEKSIVNSILKEHKERVEFPYIGCFSTKSDLLSQWRAYGDDGKGVAIGFEVGKIPHYDLLKKEHGNCGDIPIIIDEIAYDEKNNEVTFIEKIIQACLLIYRKTNNINHAISAGVQGLNLLSVFSKNVDFEEENEVRMAYFPCYFDLIANLSELPTINANKMELKFRTNRDKLISYYEFNLPQNAIQRIVLGPKCSIDKNQLTLFLNKYSPDVRRKNGIVKSNITYR